ncbi:hypothetical protein Pcinc_033409 [Petrolisthes cinctipes]|uniref:Uncharacterized protein n=1 Tax=Petrolisthes cinctipes TaxID=88211 RepID=A0AAE1ESB5_PETCI|nr:hypothetical protein Pcinc_033409 [Petrolisthes cinctipes]
MAGVMYQGYASYLQAYQRSPYCPPSAPLPLNHYDKAYLSTPINHNNMVAITLHAPITSTPQPCTSVPILFDSTIAAFPSVLAFLQVILIGST